MGEATPPHPKYWKHIEQLFGQNVLEPNGNVFFLFPWNVADHSREVSSFQSLCEFKVNMIHHNLHAAYLHQPILSILMQSTLPVSISSF